MLNNNKKRQAEPKKTHINIFKSLGQTPSNAKKSKKPFNFKIFHETSLLRAFTANCYNTENYYILELNKTLEAHEKNSITQTFNHTKNKSKNFAIELYQNFIFLKFFKRTQLHRELIELGLINSIITKEKLLEIENKNLFAYSSLFDEIKTFCANQTEKTLSSQQDQASKNEPAPIAHNEEKISSTLSDKEITFNISIESLDKEKLLPVNMATTATISEEKIEEVITLDEIPSNSSISFFYKKEPPAQLSSTIAPVNLSEEKDLKELTPDEMENTLSEWTKTFS